MNACFKVHIGNNAIVGLILVQYQQKIHRVRLEFAFSESTHFCKIKFATSFQWRSAVPSYTFSKSVYSYFHNFVSNFKKLCQYANNEFRDFASNVQLSGTYCDFLNKFIENEKTIAHRNCVYLLSLSC